MYPVHAQTQHYPNKLNTIQLHILCIHIHKAIFTCRHIPKIIYGPLTPPQAGPIYYSTKNHTPPSDSFTAPVGLYFLFKISRKKDGRVCVFVLSTQEIPVSQTPLYYSANGIFSHLNFFYCTRVQYQMFNKLFAWRVHIVLL